MRSASVSVLCGWSLIIIIALCLVHHWQSEMPIVAISESSNRENGSLNAGTTNAASLIGTNTTETISIDEEANKHDIASSNVVRGHVLTEGGQPIPEAKVQIRVFPEGAIDKTVAELVPSIDFVVLTNESGYYEHGLYWKAPIVITAESHGKGTAAIDGFGPGTYDLVLPHEALCRVIVRDTEQAPIEGARIAISGLDIPLISIGYSQANGVAIVRGARPGKVGIVADHKQFCRFEEKCEIGESETTDIEITLQKGGVIYGIVVDAESEVGIPDARVGLHYREHHSVNTDEGGRFALNGVPFDYTWDVHAKANGYPSCVKYVSMSEENIGTELRIELRRGRTLVGSIRCPNGFLAEARILASGYCGDADKGGMDIDNSYANSRTDGSFELRHLRKDVRYTVIVAHPLWSREAFLLGPGDEPIIDIGAIEIGEAGAVLGYVMDENFNPLENAQIIISPPNPAKLDIGISTGSNWNIGFLMDPPLTKMSCYSNADGVFRVHGLPLGAEVLLECSRKGYISSRQKLQIVPSTEVDLVLKRGAGIRGRVLNENGNTISQAKIKVGVIPRKSGRADFVPEIIATLTSDAGEFAVDDVPPGNVLIEVEHGEYLPLQIHKLLNVGTHDELDIITMESKRQSVVNRYVVLCKQVNEAVNEVELKTMLMSVQGDSEQGILDAIIGYMPDIDLEAVKGLRHNEDIVRCVDQAQVAAKYIVDGYFVSDFGSDPKLSDEIQKMLWEASIKLIELQSRIIQDKKLDSAAYGLYRQDQRNAKQQLEAQLKQNSDGIERLGIDVSEVVELWQQRTRQIVKQLKN